MATSGFATQRSFIILNRDLLLYAILIFLYGPVLPSAGASPLSSSGSFTSQAFWLLVFANSMVLAALRKGNLPGLVLALGWLLPLTIWIMASYYWSAFPDLRCLVPDFDGASSSHDSKEALWDKFYTAAPPRRRQSVEQYKIVKRA